MVAGRGEGGQVGPGVRRRVVYLGGRDVCECGITADRVKLARSRDQRMTTACVMHLRKFCPRPAVETEQAGGVSTKAVAADQVNAIVQGGGRRVVEADRQAWTRAPCGAIEHPD